jgi:NitT/TauT family transport system ATP-binding protein
MSHSPGTVLEELRVPFARPRERELVTEAGFVALKRRCLALLRYPLASPMAASNDAPARIDISHSVLS